MLVVETIAKIRRAYFQDKKPIKQICRELRVSRNTVRRVIDGQAGATRVHVVLPVAATRESGGDPRAAVTGAA